MSAALFLCLGVDALICLDLAQSVIKAPVYKVVENDRSIQRKRSMPLIDILGGKHRDTRIISSPAVYQKAETCVFRANGHPLVGRFFTLERDRRKGSVFNETAVLKV